MSGPGRAELGSAVHCSADYFKQEPCSKAQLGVLYWGCNDATIILSDKEGGTARMPYAGYRKVMFFFIPELHYL